MGLKMGILRESMTRGNLTVPIEGSGTKATISRYNQANGAVELSLGKI